MSKLIAVWGSPGSGKTAFSIKLAEVLYNRSRGKCAVIVVFTDIVTPTIPVIFPNFRSEDVYSLGSILSKPDFFADDVVSNMVMTKSRMNLGYLGYKDGENNHSFPEYTAEKAKYFYDVLLGTIPSPMVITDIYNDVNEILLKEPILLNSVLSELKEYTTKSGN